MGKKVLLVGGCGFLGRSLAEHLSSQGFEIRILDLPEAVAQYQPSDPRITCTSGDFYALKTDDDLFSGVDTVFHLVHTTIPSTSMNDAFYDAQTNILPSIRLFGIVAERRVPRVIFISSGGTVYGVPRKVPISEDHPTAPICPYGMSKLAIESYLRQFSDQYGFKGVSVRLSNPYGKHQLPGKPIGAVAAFLVRAARDQEIEIWGDGSVVRDYIDISDVMTALQKITESPTIPSGSYNLGYGKGHSLNQLLDLIRQVTGKIPRAAHKQNRGFDVPEIILDCKKLMTSIEWTPKVELADGLRKLWRHLNE